MTNRFRVRAFALIIAPILALAGVVLLLLLLGQATPTSASNSQTRLIRSSNGTFVVSGSVTDAATGSGMPDVVVYVWNRYRGTGFEGDRTDSAGRYRVVLDAGNYELSFTPPCGSGYASQSYKGIAGPPDVTRDVVLWPGYTVSGTVYAPDGYSPVSDVALYAFNRDTAEGFGLPPTDQNGRYCVSLVTGTYELSFIPPPCLGFGPEHIDLILDHDIVTDVILAAGFTVGGCVIDKREVSVPGVQIYAKDPDIGGYGLAPTDESGCYSGTLPLAGRPSTGTYDIQFIPPPNLDLGSLTITDVTSSTSDCPNALLPITLPSGYTLSGQVTCNGEEIKNVFVHALPQEEQNPQNSLPGYGLFTVDNGTYELPLVSGTYRVDFIPPESAELRASAFTMTTILTDTVLDVDFCVCAGKWVSATVDSAGDVGRSTSLALAPTYPYTRHVSYHDTSEGVLRHAELDETTWRSMPVDDAYIGSSLALMPAAPYTPCISYGSPTPDANLMYACWQSTGWITKLVHGPWSGLYESSLALENREPFTPHISYLAPRHSNGLKHVYQRDGQWEVEIVDTRGRYTSLALAPAYPPVVHMSYYDSAKGDLRYASKLDDAGWLTKTVDSEGDVGSWSSLVLDQSGNPHISYYDATNGDLKHAQWNGATWHTEIVDSEGQVGKHTSIAIDRRNRPCISYYDETSQDLRVARFDGAVWIIQKVDSTGEVGQYSSLALDPAGCPHISYYDATNGDLRYAYMPAIPVQASFVALPTAFTVVFSNTSSGGYVESLWDFGDGTTSTEDSPAHTYIAPGHYTVVLVVRGAGGLDTSTASVGVDYSRVYLPISLYQPLSLV